MNIMEQTPANILTDEAKRLKIFRQQEGLTQQEFAEKLGNGIRQPTIQRYESGRLIIPIDVVKDINKIFGISLEWFFNGSGTAKNSKEKEGGLITVTRNLQNDYDLLMNEVKSLKKEFKKLHNEVYELKHGIQNRDIQ